MNQKSSALLVAPPGLLREGLRAVLNALPGLDTVREADSVAQALDAMHEPVFVLLSAGGPENNTFSAIRNIKVRWPAVPCIVLVDTVAQQQSAETAGAEEVVITGVRPDRLLRSIEGFLS